MRFLFFILALFVASPAHSERLKCEVNFKWEVSDKTTLGNVDVQLPDSFGKALFTSNIDGEDVEVIRHSVGKGAIDIDYSQKSYDLIFTNKGDYKDNSWIGFFLEAGHVNVVTIETWKENMPIYIYDGPGFKSDPSTGICSR